MAISFDESKAQNQKLSFEQLAPFISGKMGRAPKTYPELVDSRGRYTNGAYLLSDQCPWHIVVKSDSAYTRLEGSILKQMEDAIDIISSMNPEVKIVNRACKYKRYQTHIVREGLVNAIIHFDASRMEDIVVTVDQDLLSIKSPGGILVTKEWRDITCTNPRNWSVAKLMASLGLATLKGRGITMMRNGYSGSCLIPCIMESKGSFILNLPALDNPVKNMDVGSEMLCDYLCRRPGSGINNISTELMVSKYLVKKMIENLESRGVVFSMGVGNEMRVYLTDSGNETGDGMERCDQESFST